MSQTKKSLRLRSTEESRQASRPKRAAKSADTTERLAVRHVLARHDISPASKKAIEDLAVEFAPALKRLADR